MTHDGIRTAIDRKTKEVTVSVPLAGLMALIEERDALERDLLMERELAKINRGIDTVKYPNGSIEGGWDIQDGDEMVTVEVPPPVGDCSCKAPVADRIVLGGKLPRRDDFERAVCGSRQPPSQEAEMAAPLPVLNDKPFVKDKGAGNPSKTVAPWSSKLTPNQTALIIRMLAAGANGVTVAANARCLTQHVGGVMTHYRTQIEAMTEIQDQWEREKFLDSLYRQMLARWQAAGKDPAVQPELPVPNKTISAAAGVGQKKGKAGNL